MPNPTLAEVVLRRRVSAGITRERLAVAADTSVATIARLEREGRIPSLDILGRIAKELDVSVSDLLDESAPVEPKAAR